MKRIKKTQNKGMYFLMGVAVLLFSLVFAYVSCLIKEKIRDNMPGVKRGSCFIKH